MVWVGWLLSFVLQKLLDLSLAKILSGDRYPMSISSPTSYHSAASTLTAFQLTYLPFPEPTPGPLYMPFLLLAMPFLSIFLINIRLYFQDFV